MFKAKLVLKISDYNSLLNYINKPIWLLNLIIVNYSLLLSDFKNKKDEVSIFNIIYYHKDEFFKDLSIMHLIKDCFLLRYVRYPINLSESIIKNILYAKYTRPYYDEILLDSDGNNTTWKKLLELEFEKEPFSYKSYLKCYKSKYGCLRGGVFLVNQST